MVDKRNRHPQPFDVAEGGQAFSFGNTQINRKAHHSLINRPCGEYANPPSLDPSMDCRRARREQQVFAAAQNRLVIGNQHRPHRHELQGQPRFARA